jgi:hypothetical protein
VFDFNQAKGDLIVFNIKTLAMAAAVSAGVVLAAPVASQAMPVTSPVHVKTGSDSGIINVNNKNKSRDWWRRHCQISNDVKCPGNYTRSYRRHHSERYYGHYRPYRHHHRSGVTIKVD